MLVEPLFILAWPNARPPVYRPFDSQGRGNSIKAQRPLTAQNGCCRYLMPTACGRDRFKQVDSNAWLRGLPTKTAP